MSDNSPVIGACLYAIQMLVRNVHWHITPADTGRGAALCGSLRRHALSGLAMPWAMFISEVLSFLIYGFSYFEVIYKRREGLHPPPNVDGTRPLPSLYDDGLIGVGKLAPRAQESLLRWEFDQTGSLLGMHQLDTWMGRQAYIPYEKALLFRPTSYKDSPEGRSVLRNAYQPYYMIAHIQNVEGIGIERDLTRLPVLAPQWWLRRPRRRRKTWRSSEMAKHIGRNIRLMSKPVWCIRSFMTSRIIRCLRFTWPPVGPKRSTPMPSFSGTNCARSRCCVTCSLWAMKTSALCAGVE
jgi:hypothetical protein